MTDPMMHLRSLVGNVPFADSSDCHAARYCRDLGSGRREIGEAQPARE